MTTPKVIFIVPYRAREQQKAFFYRHMSYVMEDFPRTYYDIFFVHQLDTREFNRGAMKNAGFLAMRERYPDNYKDITFVFNDVDCCPFTKNFLQYETTSGIVKHFYGFTYTLGGIVSITGADFERVNGFPNFFGYGYEDNMLQQRVIAAGMKIDRSTFFKLYDQNIMSFRDGITRNINSTDFDMYIKNTKEGLQSFLALNYRIENEFIQIDHFDCGRTENLATKREYDLRKGNAIFGGGVGKKNNFGLMKSVSVKKQKIKMNL